MVEMEYKDERETVLLENKNYNGFDYYIISYGTHPCAYIQLKEGNVFFGENYDYIDIPCHGEFTYSENELGEFVSSSDNVWVIGWDYAHDSDKFGTDDDSGKNWTLSEIRNEVKSVINELRYMETIRD